MEQLCLQAEPAARTPQILKDALNSL
jgi:hypothetical protein